MNGSPHVWIPKALTKLDKFKASFAPGRKKKVSPGSHLHDLVSLRKTVLMCPTCNYKFVQIYKRHGYRQTPFKAESDCDDCRRPSRDTTVYSPEEFFSHHAGSDHVLPTKPKYQPFKRFLT